MKKFTCILAAIVFFFAGFSQPSEKKQPDKPKLSESVNPDNVSNLSDQRVVLSLAVRPDKTLQIEGTDDSLDALGKTNWYQAMWPTDAGMPGKDFREFPRFHVDPVDDHAPGVTIGKRLPRTPDLDSLLPSISFSVKMADKTIPLYSGMDNAQIAYRVGNLLRLIDTSSPIARQTEVIFFSHNLIITRIRLEGNLKSELQAEVKVKAPDKGKLYQKDQTSWSVKNDRGYHGVILAPGKSGGEILSIMAYDAGSLTQLEELLDRGQSEATHFDKLWQKVAGPHSIEPFLIGNETAEERNIIAAFVNRVLRNARSAGNIRQPSMLEFFGKEWPNANGTWICFLPPCRYTLWIEPSFWKNSINTLLDYQTPDGMVPQAVFPESVFTYSQIPNISTIVRDYYVFTGDREFLQNSYSKFKAWYEWWMKERNPSGDGIIAIGSSGQGLWTAICEYKDNHTDPDKPSFEDTCNPLTRTKEIAGRPERVYLPDIVACQARMAEDLAFMARELNLKNDADYFANEYNRVKNWANKNLWDEKTRFYYPVERATGKKLMKRSNVAFWMLWAGIPGEEQKDALVEAMFDSQQFFTNIPLPMIAVNDPTFNPKCGHWGDGYVWPLDVYHAFDGLLRYGEWDRAALLATRFNSGVFTAIKDSYGPHEFYHHSGRPAGHHIMGTAGLLPLMFQKYLQDYHKNSAQTNWQKFAPVPPTR